MKMSIMWKWNNVMKISIMSILIIIISMIIIIMGESNNKRNNGENNEIIININEIMKIMWRK